MIEWFFLGFWALWLLLVIVAALRVLSFQPGKFLQKRRWGDGSSDQKPAVVILPVKGMDPVSSPRFFDAIFDQDYSHYRVIVCFEQWEDSVAQWLTEQLQVTPESPDWYPPEPVRGLQRVTLVAAGAATTRGQKVHNQLAALEHLEPDDKIVVFADADIECGRDWLPLLTAPVNRGTHPLSTTYRWLVPKRPTLPNQLASVINASIATQGGSEWSTVLWGGSMAVNRKVFDSLEVPKLFDGSLNDDLRLSKAARRAGHRIAFVRSLILPTTVDFTWSSMIEFGRRQYTQVKFFSPILYTCTNLLVGLYALGLLSAIAGIVYGYFWAWAPIAAAYVIDQFRAVARQRIYFSLFQDDTIRWRLSSTAWLEHMLTPAWMLLHWAIIVSTWFKHRITWAGIQYRILSPEVTKVVRRPDPVEVMPHVMPNLELYRRSLRARSRPVTPESVAALTGALSHEPSLPTEPADTLAETSRESGFETGSDPGFEHEFAGTEFPPSETLTLSANDEGGETQLTIAPAPGVIDGVESPPGQESGPSEPAESSATLSDSLVETDEPSPLPVQETAPDEPTAPGLAGEEENPEAPREDTPQTLSLSPVATAGAEVTVPEPVVYTPIALDPDTGRASPESESLPPAAASGERDEEEKVIETPEEPSSEPRVLDSPQSEESTVPPDRAPDPLPSSQDAVAPLPSAPDEPEPLPSPPEEPEPLPPLPDETQERVSRAGRASLARARSLLEGEAPKAVTHSIGGDRIVGTAAVVPLAAAVVKRGKRRTRPVPHPSIERRREKSRRRSSRVRRKRIRSLYTPSTGGTSAAETKPVTVPTAPTVTPTKNSVAPATEKQSAVNGFSRPVRPGGRRARLRSLHRSRRRKPSGSRARNRGESKQFPSLRRKSRLRRP